MKELSKHNYEDISSSRGEPVRVTNEGISNLGDSGRSEVTLPTWSKILSESVKLTNKIDSLPMTASDDDACSGLVERGEIDPDHRVGRKTREVQFVHLDSDYDEYDATTDGYFDVTIFAYTRGEIENISNYTTTDTPAVAELEISMSTAKYFPERNEVVDNNWLIFSVGILTDQTISYEASYEGGPYTELIDRFKENCEKYGIPLDLSDDSSKDEVIEKLGEASKCSKGNMAQEQAEKFALLLRELNNNIY